MLKRIRNPQDFLAGWMFAVIGALVLYDTSNLQFGTLMRMGPGFFPIVLAFILLGFAGVLIVRSIVGPKHSVELFLSRHSLVIVVATVFFGLLIGPLGFVPALVVLVTLSSFADSNLSWLDTAKLVVALTLGSVILFVYLLKQPIALFGPYLTAF